MKIYRINNKKHLWGDYGDILLTGCVHKDKQNHQIILERTGPYVPPMTIFLDNLIITNEVKEKLENSDLTGFGFAKVIKKHIVELDWMNWDQTSDEPEYLPSSGEPYDYLLEKQHSPELADRIGDIWAIVLEECGQIKGNNRLKINSSFGDIFIPENKWFILITEKAKKWIEKNACDWIEFEEIKITKNIFDWFK